MQFHLNTVHQYGKPNTDTPHNVRPLLGMKVLAEAQESMDALLFSFAILASRSTQTSLEV